jgi:uncharacterized protein
MVVQDPAETLSARVRADLQIAMAARRTEEVRLLRALLAAIDDAQAVPLPEGHQRYSPRAFGDGSGEVPRIRLSAERIEALVTAEIDARLEAAGQMAGLDRPDRADALQAEAALLGRYRPA